MVIIHSSERPLQSEELLDLPSHGLPPRRFHTHLEWNAVKDPQDSGFIEYQIPKDSEGSDPLRDELPSTLASPIGSPEPQVICTQSTRPYSFNSAGFLLNTSPMPRKSERFLWKEGDGDGKKGDAHPKLYNKPPYKLVEGDEKIYPPSFVDLSLMWVFQIIQYLFIIQEERYKQQPHVFPSKEPLKASQVNQGLALKIWSTVANAQVYPIIFSKYQLHGDEGAEFDINQSKFISSKHINATYNIKEGAECVKQEPPTSSTSPSSGGLATAEEKKVEEKEGSNNKDPKPKPKHRKIQTGKRSKVTVQPKVASPTTTVQPNTASPATKAPAPKPALKVATTGRQKKAAKSKTVPKKSTTKLVSSATGGNRFAINNSESEEYQADKADLAAIKLEKAHLEQQLEQA